MDNDKLDQNNNNSHEVHSDDTGKVPEFKSVKPKNLQKTLVLKRTEDKLKSNTDDSSKRSKIIVPERSSSRSISSVKPGSLKLNLGDTQTKDKPTHDLKSINGQEKDKNTQDNLNVSKNTLNLANLKTKNLDETQKENNIISLSDKNKSNIHNSDKLHSVGRTLKLNRPNTSNKISSDTVKEPDLSDEAGLNSLSGNIKNIEQKKSSDFVKTLKLRSKKTSSGNDTISTQAAKTNTSSLLNTLKLRTKREYSPNGEAKTSSFLKDTLSIKANLEENPGDNESILTKTIKLKTPKKKEALDLTKTIKLKTVLDNSDNSKKEDESLENSSGSNSEEQDYSKNINLIKLRNQKIQNTSELATRTITIKPPEPTPNVVAEDKGKEDESKPKRTLKLSTLQGTDTREKLTQNDLEDNELNDLPTIEHTEPSENFIEQTKIFEAVKGAATENENNDFQEDSIKKASLPNLTDIVNDIREEKKKFRSETNINKVSLDTNEKVEEKAGTLNLIVGFLTFIALLFYIYYACTSYFLIS